MSHEPVHIMSDDEVFAYLPLLDEAYAQSLKANFIINIQCLVDYHPALTRQIVLRLINHPSTKYKLKRDGSYGMNTTVLG